MIEGWSYDDGNLEKRKLCLACFSKAGLGINKSIYEFCQDYIESGKLEQFLPTQENNMLQDEVKKYDGDYLRMTCDAIMKEYNNR